MIKKTIIATVQDVVSKLTEEEVDIELSIPTDLSHGDYTTNVAFHLAKTMKKSPFVIAQEIVSKLQTFKSSEIEKIEAAQPGFINFTISKKILFEKMQDLIENPEQALSAIHVPKRRFEMYENTQPNTNKPLHIGHMRNMALATAIVNLRKALGHKVWSVNINNDRGIHIIKAMWAYLQFGREDFNNTAAIKDFVVASHFNSMQKQTTWNALLARWVKNKAEWQVPKTHSIKSDHFVGMFYTLGDKGEKQVEARATDEMKAMLLAWEANDPDIRKLWTTMNTWFYEGFKQTHARFLGIKSTDPQFDHEWYESQLYQKGRQIILDNVGKGLLYKREDGVIMADLKKYNLPDKVVIRSDGSSLYITFDLEEAREMALDYKADLIIHIVANEQELYFKQVFAIVDALKIAPKEHFLHIAYGMVNLKGGVKMSSRLGNVISIDELLDIVKKDIISSFKTEDSETAEHIALGAMKYAMLKNNPKANIEFDLESSISLEGNSGPYIQYAYARTQSVLEKVKSQKSKVKSPFEHGAMNHEEETLLRLISQCSEVLCDAAQTYTPNILCEYLFTLAKTFNLFYQKHRILNAENVQKIELRIELVKGVATVIKNGLSILGIVAVEKM